MDNVIISALISGIVSFAVANIYIKKCYAAFEESIKEYAQQVAEVAIQSMSSAKRP